MMAVHSASSDGLEECPAQVNRLVMCFLIRK
jgi:hypothetical protein